MRLLMIVFMCIILVFNASNSDASDVYNMKYINVGAPECAHCLAMALLGPDIDGKQVRFHPYNTISSLVTSLLTDRVQIAQVDYPSLVSLISRNVPIVAISGEVNGGSDFVLSNSIDIKKGDWKSLAKEIKANYKTKGKFTIGTQFGTVQNVDIRLALIKHGIEAKKYIEFFNMPFQGMPGALTTHRVDAAVPVQPVASMITLGKIARHFSYLYHQPAGNLTNVVIVTRKFYNHNPILDSDIALAMVNLVNYTKRPYGNAAWKKAIMKYTNFKYEVVNHALKTLVPDFKMPISKVSHIAKSMYDNGLINNDPSESVLRQFIKYRYLSEATGLPEKDLGKY